MLLDTSGLFSFFDENDFRNSEAVSQVREAEFLLTHSYVLAEFIPLCQVRGLDRSKTLDFVEALLENELIEIVWVDESIHRSAFELLQNRLDKTYSLCDAISFLVMRERGIPVSLTTDKHFEQEGFIKLLKS
jgi:predicted nucleic acid-binding protein